MKSKMALVIGSLSVAALVSSGAAWAQSPGTKKGDTIHPKTSGPGSSQGGSQSERTREDGTPLAKDSPYSGTVEMGKGASGSRGAGMSGSTNVKEVQQALKDKGHDPGPIDGVMGAKTKEALKSFQTASNIQATGTLNAETAQKLGVNGGSSSSAGASSSSGSRGTSKSSDTTVGKDSDQPNQPPMKNR